MIIGLGDTGVSLAYILCILTTLLCVVYGIINWNKPVQAEEDKQIQEEIISEKNDPELRDEGGQL